MGQNEITTMRATRVPYCLFDVDKYPSGLNTILPFLHGHFLL